MTEEVKETCPICGSAVKATNESGWTVFECRSKAMTIDGEGFFHESDTCTFRELRAENAALRDKVAKLEGMCESMKEAFIASHNGDIQIKWNPDGFWAYGRDRDQSLVTLAGPCEEAVDAALAALTKGTDHAE